MTLNRVCTALLMIAVSVPAAHAWHIQGKIYCDANSNSLIDPTIDTPLNNIRVQVSSKTITDVRADDSGDNFPLALGPGGYRVGLADRTDDYKVELINLPAGFMIVLPPPADGGMYMVHLDTTTQNKQDADFLLKSCGETTTTTTATTSTTVTTNPGQGSTTTTVTTTTGSTTTATTTTATTATTSSTTATTTTTTLPGSSCGNAIIDTGEQCDPPGSSCTGAFTGTCTPTCTCPCIPMPEICGNTVDDDCDLLVDCVDPDCSNLPPCLVRKDPARILWGPPGQARDYFRAHGRVKLGAPVDLNTAAIGWVLSNAQGMIYLAGLQAGDLALTGTQFKFQDNDVRRGGEGSRKGIWLTRVNITRRGTAYFWIRAYGDLSRATDPVMTLQLHIGDQWFGVSGVWRKTGRGWIFWGRALERAVGAASPTFMR